MALQQNLGFAIQKLRREYGLSQEQLALKADIDRRYMSDIENGKRNLSIGILERLANAFRINCSDLFAYAEQYAPKKDDNSDIKKWLCDMGYEETVLFENPTYRDAIVGISENGRLIYSERKILDYMIHEEGLDDEEALDNYSYNILRSLPYMGKMAPIIMSDIDM